MRLSEKTEEGVGVGGLEGLPSFPSELGKCTCICFLGFGGSDYSGAETSPFHSIAHSVGDVATAAGVLLFVPHGHWGVHFVSEAML